MEKQFTLDGQVMPVAPHRDDIIVTEDGVKMRRGDVKFYDCRGRAFYDEENRNDMDDQIVTDILDERAAWIDDYCASDDYGYSYAYIVFENDSTYFKDNIRKWLFDNYYDGNYYSERSIYNVYLECALIDGIMDKLHECDLEAYFYSNEYACWYGSGCAVDSIEVGEFEDQIDVNSIEEFVELNAQGRLFDILNCYKGDLCINIREKDLEGRYPCFYGYGGYGRWHYVFSDESMEEALCAAIIDYCRRTDCSDE